MLSRFQTVGDISRQTSGRGRDVTRRRRPFSPEFKEEAVRMVLEGEWTVASVAREFGINASTLGSRVHRRRIVLEEAEHPVPGPERARIPELERENAELREKLAFLKKAALDSDEQRNAACGWVDRGPSQGERGSQSSPSGCNNPHSRS
ncbi:MULTISPECIES: transposase [unclassified Nonomuraea]|uniref:transposase n=1 Tax=unclassified Nonomuraea TaxID=2593643 RepID=UPI0033FE3851